MAEMTPIADRYRAFLSYRSHDRALAERLHAWLENYRVPRGLVGKTSSFGEPIPGRIGRIFRDRTDAAGSQDLDAELQRGLEQSQNLIVLCTPRAAEKESWVNREILLFRSLNPNGRILPIIADGEPPECFPEALLSRDEEGRIVVPLAPDMRSGRGPNGARRGDGVDMARVKLVAGLLGCELDDLWRRDRRRRAQKAFAAVAVGGILTSALIGGFAAWRHQVRTERVAAELARSQDPDHKIALALSLIPAEGSALGVPAKVRLLAHSTLLEATARSDAGSRFAAWQGHVGRVMGLALAKPATLVSAGADGSVQVWDVGARTKVGAFSGLCACPIEQVAASGGVAVAAARDGYVFTLDLDRRIVRSRTYAGRIIAIALQPGGQRVLAVDQDGVLAWSGSQHPRRIYHAPQKIKEASLGAALAALTFADGRRVLLALNRPNPQEVPTGFSAETRIFVAKNRPVAAGIDVSGTVRVIDFEKSDATLQPAGAPVIGPSIPQTPIDALVVSDDGQVAGIAGQSPVWPGGRAGQPHAFPLSAPIVALAIIGRGQAVWGEANGALFSSDQSQWRALSGGAGGNVLAVSESGDGTFSALAEHGRIFAWTAGGAAYAETWRAPGSVATSAVAAANDAEFAIGDEEGSITVVRPRSQPLRIAAHTTPVSLLASDAAGLVIASAARGNLAFDDLDARIWNARTGTEIARVPQQGAVQALSMSGDGRFLATGGSDRTVRLIDLKGAASTKTWTLPSSIAALAINSEAGIVAAAGSDGAVAIFSTGKDPAKNPLPIKSASAAVAALAFDRAGRRLAVLGRDGAGSIFELATGRSLPFHIDGGASDVFFSQDGQLIFAIAGDEKEHVRIRSWRTVDMQPMSSDVFAGRRMAVMSRSYGVWMALGYGGAAILDLPDQPPSREQYCSHYRSASGGGVLLFSLSAEAARSCSDVGALAAAGAWPRHIREFILTHFGARQGRGA
ncbi:MAG: toll/interleukin-1 receptor domain-containing protein [Caulobacterales bacterium]